MSVLIEPLTPAYLDQAVEIWAPGWRDAHVDIVPAARTALRTTDSFRERMTAHMAQTSIARVDGDALGFCILKDDELYQIYVSAQARGQGVAPMLTADAEARFRTAGHQNVWLACSVGNDRAARFYEKSGWKNAGVKTVDLDTSSGPFPLEIWRFEKSLR